MTEHVDFGKRRILHTMLRVGDLERSIHFYTHVLGMRVLRRFEPEGEGYRLAFLGFGEENQTEVLELTHNHGVVSYQHGNAYGHLAIGVDDINRASGLIEQRQGGVISRKPGPLKGSHEVIAFAVDPDGYKIELIQRDASWFPPASPLG